MKKFIFLLALIITTTLQMQAQNVGFVDTEFVLEKLPDYSDAQKQLNQIVEGWSKEVEEQYKDIERMQKQFQAEQVLLSDKERAEKKAMIEKREEETRALQSKRFGTSGDLQAKRAELVKPIQEKVYKAVEKVAKELKADIIFDKASGINILYGNPKFDLTNKVLKELGISSK